ncbi:MAG TPA: type II toxin-antitoxin system prevent-host-death family antitoxin [Nitrosomonas sp.]|nr:type II toxin-antitoxin system prevent-host-death family antitoxin [Nitrosomonas sp.]
MQIYNIPDAKTQLSRLVEHAAKGEPFIIGKTGKPKVKVVMHLMRLSLLRSSDSV